MKSKWYEKVYMGLFGYVCFFIGLTCVLYGLNALFSDNAFGGIVMLCIGGGILSGVKGMVDDYAKDGEK